MQISQERGAFKYHLIAVHSNITGARCIQFNLCILFNLYSSWVMHPVYSAVLCLIPVTYIQHTDTIKELLNYTDWDSSVMRTSDYLWFQTTSPPPPHLSIFGNRSFGYSTPAAWNSLPKQLYDSSICLLSFNSIQTLIFQGQKSVNYSCTEYGKMVNKGLLLKQH